MYVVVLLLWSIMLHRIRSLFFFFKQKTAYEMRISDWSSDVCSSDRTMHRLFVALRPPRDIRALLIAAMGGVRAARRSEEHTSELQSLMRISYAVFCLKKKNQKTT